MSIQKNQNKLQANIKQTNKQGRENYKETTGTKLITNTKKQKLKIQSRVWNFRYTMLYKRRRERNRGGKKSHRNYKKKLQVQN